MLLTVTATKSSIVKSSLIAFFEIFFLGLIFVESIIRYINPIRYASLLYPYGYGIYARNLSIILGNLIILLLILFFFIIRKHRLNQMITSYLFFPVILFSLIGFFAMSFKETKLMISYTTNIKQYEVYDEVVTKEVSSISEYLPSKEAINKYEYLLYADKNSTMVDKSWNFSMFLKTEYDQNIHNNVVNNEGIHSKEELDDTLLTEYECYQYVIPESKQLRRPVLSHLFILINKSKNIIIYAIVSENIDIFQKIDNHFYIGTFINESRDTPYYLYP